MGPGIAADIRLLTSIDLPGAITLSSTAGWNQRPADWEMLLRLAPRGSFAALADGRVVGTAIGIDYGGFSWIAMMLVDPTYRGQGLGARLLEAAMSACPADRPIRLDATPMGRPLYQRYGFEDETMLTRYVADARRNPIEEEPGRARVRPLTADDLDAVAIWDRAVFGGERRAVLEWMLANAGDYAFTIRDQEDLEQEARRSGGSCCFGRSGRLFDQIGPVVAANEKEAIDLVAAVLANAGGKALVVDAFDAHTGFTDFLRSRGFAPQRPLFRMCRPGARSVPREPPHAVEYAILGPEFG